VCVLNVALLRLNPHSRVTSQYLQPAISRKWQWGATPTMQQLIETRASVTTMLPTFADKNWMEVKIVTVMDFTTFVQRLQKISYNWFIYSGTWPYVNGCVVTTQCLHLQGPAVHDNYLILKMEALWSSETFGTTCSMTHCQVPKAQIFGNTAVKTLSLSNIIIYTTLYIVARL
jgi:hypothetical protein